jgi:hypothetical protein
VVDEPTVVGVAGAVVVVTGAAVVVVVSLTVDSPVVVDGLAELARRSLVDVVVGWHAAPASTTEASRATVVARSFEVLTGLLRVDHARGEGGGGGATCGSYRRRGCRLERWRRSRTEVVTSCPVRPGTKVPNR